MNIVSFSPFGYEGALVVVEVDLHRKNYLLDNRREADGEINISGLDVATKVVRDIEDISICTLTSKDVVRHPLVQQIVKAYEDYEKKAQRVKDKRR